MLRKCILFFICFVIHTLTYAQYVRAKIHDRFGTFMEGIQIKYHIDLNTQGDIYPMNVKPAFLAISDYENLLNDAERKELAYLRKQYDFLSSNQDSISVTDPLAKTQEGEFYYYNDENKEVQDKPILKYFYKNRNHFISLDKGNFSLRADPILDLSYANATNDSNVIFKNTRGLELSAIIDNKVVIYTSIYENQANFPAYGNDFVRRFYTIPSNGFYKTYNSSVLNKLRGWDYLNAQAYVGVPVSKNIQIELGHGKHFIGHGIRSLLLSDFSNNYLYLKFNASFWKFHYQTIYAELNATSSQDRYSPNSALIPKKYTANHYLTFKPSPKFDIGLFETVTFGRRDHFEFQYLNPVILYRTIEQFLNSPDNVILGLNTSYSPIKKVKFYGQFALDEFLLSEVKSGKGSWTNKFGLQLGVKAIDIIRGLNVGLEYNAVRPYTYSHYQPIDTLIGNKTITSYSHYNQSLAHPLGANFREVIFTADYRFSQKLTFNFASFFWNQGLDPIGQNYGSDILINYNSRVQDYGNKIGQGISNKVSNVRGNLTYEFFPNYNLDLSFLMRKSTVDGNTFMVGAGLRVNIAKQNLDF